MQLMRTLPSHAFGCTPTTQLLPLPIDNPAMAAIALRAMHVDIGTGPGDMPKDQWNAYFDGLVQRAHRTATTYRTFLNAQRERARLFVNEWVRSEAFEERSVFHELGRQNESEAIQRLRRLMERRLGMPKGAADSVSDEVFKSAVAEAENEQVREIVATIAIDNMQQWQQASDADSAAIVDVVRMHISNVFGVSITRVAFVFNDLVLLQMVRETLDTLVNRIIDDFLPDELTDFLSAASDDPLPAPVVPIAPVAPVVPIAPVAPDVPIAPVPPVAPVEPIAPSASDVDGRWAQVPDTHFERGKVSVRGYWPYQWRDRPGNSPPLRTFVVAAFAWAFESEQPVTAASKKASPRLFELLDCPKRAVFGVSTRVMTDSETEDVALFVPHGVPLPAFGLALYRIAYEFLVQRPTWLSNFDGFDAEHVYDAPIDGTSVLHTTSEYGSLAELINQIIVPALDEWVPEWQFGTYLRQNGPTHYPQTVVPGDLHEDHWACAVVQVAAQDARRDALLPPIGDVGMDDVNDVDDMDSVDSVDDVEDSEGSEDSEENLPLRERWRLDSLRKLHVELAADGPSAFEERTKRRVREALDYCMSIARAAFRDARNVDMTTDSETRLQTFAIHLMQELSEKLEYMNNFATMKTAPLTDPRYKEALRALQTFRNELCTRLKDLAKALIVEQQVQKSALSEEDAPLAVSAVERALSVIESNDKRNDELASNRDEDKAPASTTAMERAPHDTESEDELDYKLVSESEEDEAPPSNMAAHASKREQSALNWWRKVHEVSLRDDFDPLGERQAERRRFDKAARWMSNDEGVGLRALPRGPPGSAKWSQLLRPVVIQSPETEASIVPAWAEPFGRVVYWYARAALDELDQLVDNQGPPDGWENGVIDGLWELILSSKPFDVRLADKVTLVKQPEWTKTWMQTLVNRAVGDAERKQNATKKREDGRGSVKGDKHDSKKYGKIGGNDNNDSSDSNDDDNDGDSGGAKAAEFWFRAHHSMTSMAVTESRRILARDGFNVHPLFVGNALTSVQEEFEQMLRTLPEERADQPVGEDTRLSAGLDVLGHASTFHHPLVRHVTEEAHTYAALLFADRMTADRQMYFELLPKGVFAKEAGEAVSTPLYTRHTLPAALRAELQRVAPNRIEVKMAIEKQIARQTQQDAALGDDMDDEDDESDENDEEDESNKEREGTSFTKPDYPLTEDAVRAAWAAFEEKKMYASLRHQGFYHGFVNVSRVPIEFRLLTGEGAIFNPNDVLVEHARARFEHLAAGLPAKSHSDVNNLLDEYDVSYTRETGGRVTPASSHTPASNMTTTLVRVAPGELVIIDETLLRVHDDDAPPLPTHRTCKVTMGWRLVHKTKLPQKKGAVPLKSMVDHLCVGMTAKVIAEEKAQIRRKERHESTKFSGDASEGREDNPSDDENKSEDQPKYAIPRDLNDVLLRQAVVPRIFGPGPRDGINAFQPPPFPRMYRATAEYGEAELSELATEIATFAGRLRPWIAPPSINDPFDALSALNTKLPATYSAPHDVDPAMHMPALVDLARMGPLKGDNDVRAHPPYTEAEIAMRRPSRQWTTATISGEMHVFSMDA